MTKKPEHDPQDPKADDMDEGSQPSVAERAKELRNLAIVFEIAPAEDLAGFADLNIPLSTGNLQEFPRPAPDLRAAEQGVEYLRQSVERDSAMLDALAAGREQGLEIPPAFRDHVELYRLNFGTRGGEEDR
jgi:hypothetical protein